MTKMKSVTAWSSEREKRRSSGVNFWKESGGEIEREGRKGVLPSRVQEERNSLLEFITNFDHGSVGEEITSAKRNKEMRKEKEKEREREKEKEKEKRKREKEKKGGKRKKRKKTS